MIPLTIQDNTLTLPVKVTPKSTRNECSPFKASDVAMKLKVTVPPENGEANKAVIELLAQLSHLPKSAITLLTGKSSRQKVMKLETTNTEETLVHLAQAMRTKVEHCFEIDSRTR